MRTRVQGTCDVAAVAAAAAADPAVAARLAITLSATLFQLASPAATNAPTQPYTNASPPPSDDAATTLDVASPVEDEQLAQ